MSSLGWIDFSSEHRDKVRTVIDFLATPGVIDELGIGVIRDSFADRMFPGISTIQTRPKYFTLTALLLKDYLETEKIKRRPRSLARYLEEEEKWCRIQLVERHGEGRQNLGIIGGSFGTREDRDVVRKPSSIYWNGLRLFGFFSPPHLSLIEFGRRLTDDRYQLQSLLEETGNERGDDHDAIDQSHQLRVNAPKVSEDYWDTLSIELIPEEAEFLRLQIKARQPDSLIGQILMDDAIMDEVLELDESAGYEDFCELPFLKGLRNAELRLSAQHARDFWRLMEGAHIRYNVLLQGRMGTSELRTSFEERWEDWRQRLPDYLTGWDTEFMWRLVARHGSRVRATTRDFIEGWLEQCRSGAGDLERCNALVRRQEIQNKGNRARLRDTKQEGINDWVGLDGLDYRFREIRTLVRDIRAAELGQTGGGDDA